MGETLQIQFLSDQSLSTFQLFVHTSKDGTFFPSSPERRRSKPPTKRFKKLRVKIYLIPINTQVEKMIFLKNDIKNYVDSR